MLKLFIKFRSLLNRKYYFLIPKREEVLIYRSDGKERIHKLFNKNFIKDIDPGVEINLYVLSLTLRKCLNSDFFWVPYLKKYIELTNPKVVVTRIANDINFFLLKRDSNKNIKFICIQNGLNSGNHPLLPENIKKTIKKKLFADYIFCYSKAEKKIFQKVINSNFVITGSITNNEIEKKNFKKEKKILFLSIYRHRKDEFFSTQYNEYFRKITYNEFFQLEKKLINFLINYSQENKYKFLICGTRISKFLSSKEEKFYKELIDSKYYEYVPKSSFASNYILSDRSEITVSIESCLGYESLARGNKVALFSCRGNYLNIDKYDFKMGNSNGPFWTSSYNEVKFKNILDTLRKMKNNEWKECVNSYRNNFFYFDPENKIAKNILAKC
jgi:surface carbohydrate biosynthesis protein